jgi:hypothetical protein
MKMLKDEKGRPAGNGRRSGDLRKWGFGDVGI